MLVKHNRLYNISICYFKNMVNNKNMNNDDILQNLKDAGCDLKIAGNIISLINSGEKAPALNLIAKHRRQLLESLYENQKKIDCLDFLIFNLKQKTSSIKN